MTYVLSDIHGNYRRFQSILEQIDLGPQDTLYVLGDVIDRHPAGVELLQRLLAMPNVRLLLGNHEYMMLRAMGCPRDDNPDDGGALSHWYRNGGEVTHRALLSLPEQQRQQLLEEVGQLPLSYRVCIGEKTYRLVHGAPEESWAGERPYKNPLYYGVWKRLEGTETFPGDQTLIFGHTPTRYYQDTKPLRIWYGPKMIGIDCGSGYPQGSPGRLACLRLEDGREFYSREK